jgi:hypothetical protein
LYPEYVKGLALLNSTASADSEERNESGSRYSRREIFYKFHITLLPIYLAKETEKDLLTKLKM